MGRGITSHRIRRIENDANANTDELAIVRPFFNGSLVETIDIDVIESSGSVYARLQKNGGGDLTCRFNEESYTLDCSPALEVLLTAGTDITPVQSFLYILETDGVLTFEESTSGFPSGAHCAIATVIIQSAASLATDGAYKVHAWTDHIASDPGNGHLEHVNAKLRTFPATWISGSAAADLSVSNPDAYISTAAGLVFQMHPHTMPALDMAASDPLYVVNDPTTAYKRITTLDDVTQDASGGAINNKYFTLVLWGVVSEDEADCKLFLNLPTGTYSNSSAATTDTDNTTVYSWPSIYQGCAFLIAKYVVQGKDSGAWVQSSKTDLRGLSPSTSPGGGGSPGVFTGAGTTGLVPDPGSETDKVLQDDGTWVAAAGGGLDAAADETITGAWTFEDRTIFIDALGIWSKATGAVTATPLTALTLTAETSGNMADGFGPQIIFHTTDDTGGGSLGLLRCVRDGSDNDGKFVFEVYITLGVVKEVLELTQLAVNVNGSLNVENTSGAADVNVNDDVNVNGQITTDVIDEYTADAGVTIEGVELKDGEVDGIDIATDVAANTAKTGVTTEEQNPDVVPQAVAEAGTSADEYIWTALRVKQAIDALGGSGGAKDYASFYLTTGGVTAVAATAVTLVVNSTGINSDSGVFGLASNEVTVSKTAVFKIDANVYFNNSSTARTEYSKWLEVDTGGGYAEVAGSRFVTYQRGYDSGHSASVTLILSVTTGDKFRLRVQRTDGTATAGYQDDNGTRFTFTEIG